MAPMRAAFLALAALLVAGPAHAELTGRASVIDADTLEIQGQRIRLQGVDAPEKTQTCEAADGKPYRCGQKAALALDDWIAGRPVTCTEAANRDRYGRLIAFCKVGGVDLNGWLVEQGHAVAYRRYSMAYAAAEDRARAAKRGIWAGNFQMPWDYRAEKRKKGS